MKALAITLALVALGTWTGCTAMAQRADAINRATSGALKARVEPPPGFVWSNYHAPLTIGPTTFGSKEGKASTFLIMSPPLPFPGLTRSYPLIAWGDASEKTAAVRGHISEIKHVDYHLQVWVLVVRKYTTEVYGD